MAVLPTPGSPMSTGLFLVRRLRTWMTRRISSSRPMTGSSSACPRLRSQVAAIFLERRVGAFGVLGGHPLTAAHALERLEDGLAAGGMPLEQLLALTTDLGGGQQQVLGRDVLVAEALGLGLGALEDVPGPRVHRHRAAGDPRAAREDRGDLAAECREVHAEPAQRLGRDAVIGLEERGQDVLGIEDRAVEPLGGGLGGHDRLLGLLGEAFKLHRDVSSVVLRFSVGRVA